MAFIFDSLRLIIDRNNSTISPFQNTENEARTSCNAESVFHQAHKTVPLDLFQLTVRFLPFQDRLIASRVCKQWKLLIERIDDFHLFRKIFLHVRASLPVVVQTHYVEQDSDPAANPPTKMVLLGGRFITFPQSKEVLLSASSLTPSNPFSQYLLEQKCEFKVYYFKNYQAAFQRTGWRGALDTSYRIPVTHVEVEVTEGRLTGMQARLLNEVMDYLNILHKRRQQLES